MYRQDLALHFFAIFASSNMRVSNPVDALCRQYPLQLMQPSLAALFLGKLR